MRPEILAKIESSRPDQVLLERMSITDTELDEILECILQKRPNITGLSLCDNAISDVGAETLRKRLLEQTQLLDLDLQYNKIDRKGAKAIYSLMSTHLKLHISFFSNKLHDAGEIEDIKDAAVRARPPAPAVQASQPKKKWWKW